ncbi:MAG TPA: fused MFS/spermidine synthase [Isosphaeraceae bacterium]|nr:fused MFS/spermidine synthase [Isosphaeraceae bacterium]
MPLLFAATMFLAAALVFWVELMVGRMILPLLGGSPAVWTTCMLFFQAALLGGYAVAHAANSWLGPRRGAALQLALLAVGVLTLPPTLRAVSGPPPTSGAGPVLWLLATLAAAIGPAFLALAATAPALQRWLATTALPIARDPYPLYAASNLGSLLALVAYPTAIEPTLGLSRQASWWSLGFGVLAILTAACAIATWRAPRAPEVEEVESNRIEGRRRLRWAVLAAVPSSLLLGVTSTITTDLAPVPLLWVLPLALYLLSFVATFASRPWPPRQWASWLLAVFAVQAMATTCLGSLLPFWIPFHLLAFAAAALVCHGELARDRPPARQLTSFYLAIATGGALGGAFNAVVAPLVFDRLTEYPLMLVLACLFRTAPEPHKPRDDSRLRLEGSPGEVGPVTRAPGRLRLDGTPTLVVGALALVGLDLDAFGLNADATRLAFAMLTAGCLVFMKRPTRFALALGAVLAADGLAPDEHGRAIHRERTFFGTLAVVESDRPGGRFHQLWHGGTIHGEQALAPALRREPWAYYHREGPFGDFFGQFLENGTKRSVAVIGLGTGASSAFAAPGQRWTFFELDPAVARIARDPRYFTYLSDCRADAVAVVLGDARLRLREVPDGSFGLIAIDAFGSDSIPVHLLTREAFRLYRSKLAGGGLIAVHVTNRFLDLAPVVAAVARDGGLSCRVATDRPAGPEGRWRSTWVLLARRDADLGPLARSPRWRPIAVSPSTPAWTDDRSEIVGHFRRF